jgi:XrtN system VIT domain protein
MNTITNTDSTSLLVAGIQKVLKDTFLSAGLGLIIASTALFCVTAFTPIPRGDYFAIFFMHYVMAGGYLLALLIRGIFVLKWRFLRESVQYYIPYLILSIISAYALNREIAVFEDSTAWLCAFLVFQGIVLLSYLFFNYLPPAAQRTLYFLLGAGFVLYLYLAVYVMPLYAVSVIGLLAIGISIHTFVPFFMIIACLLLVNKYYRTDKKILYSFLAGIGLAITIAAVYAVAWARLNNIIVKEYSQSLITEDELPAWVRVCQQLPQNGLTEKLLKRGLVYSVANHTDEWFWRVPNASFDEVRKHDPLVVFSNLFSNYTALDQKEQIKILETLYDSRHQAQERLWSGENLQTQQVISNIRLWPEYRMAYTEKIITVDNKSMPQRWNQSEEALYTFHLPEGSVVTSLSLWINGVEEKGYLTTKQKADSAYRTIVGVEARDPSLIHWQEGNTVTVRVFPVTPEESRRFKIGITSPLHFNVHELSYKNIYFDGPLHEHAEEIRQINAGTELRFTPAGYRSSPDGKVEYSGNYKASWKFKIPATPLAGSTFSFLGKTYSLKHHREELETVAFKQVYLDLNAAWTLEEVREIMQLCKNAKVYAWYNNSMIRLTPANLSDVYEQCVALNFSLFPVHAIKNKQSSLLITKGTPTSPNLSDIKTSSFYQQLTEASQENSEAIKTFCLNSEELSPYLKTFKEFRLIHSVNGSLWKLEELLEKNLFPRMAENEHQLLIAPAQMLIVEEDGSSIRGAAPDHLYRLFAYNQILKKAGLQAIQKDFTDPELVAVAEQAYVVSPVSSLIVLETQKDYERFDIQKSKNSLQNATMQSTGAAPEPHEWALIAIVGLAVLVFMYPNLFKSLWPF